MAVVAHRTALCAWRSLGWCRMCPVKSVDGGGVVPAAAAAVAAVLAVMADDGTTRSKSRARTGGGGSGLLVQQLKQLRELDQQHNETSEPSVSGLGVARQWCKWFGALAATLCVCATLPTYRSRRASARRNMRRDAALGS